MVLGIRTVGVGSLSSTVVVEGIIREGLMVGILKISSGVIFIYCVTLILCSKF